MNAQECALETTERELNDAYIDLNRVMRLGQNKNAIDRAVRLAKQDEKRLWNYLRAYSSTVVNFRETNPLLVVNALWINWNQDQDISFVTHAVLTLINTTKADSALDFYNRSVKPH